MVGILIDLLAKFAVVNGLLIVAACAWTVASECRKAPVTTPERSPEERAVQSMGMAHLSYRDYKRILKNHAAYKKAARW